MTEREKKFCGKVSLIWAVITGLVALFFACILPDSTPLVIGVSCLTWLVVFSIIKVLDWLMK